MVATSEKTSRKSKNRNGLWGKIRCILVREKKEDACPVKKVYGFFSLAEL